MVIKILSYIHLKEEKIHSPRSRNAQFFDNVITMDPTLAKKNFLKKKKTFSQCVIIRNCNSSLLDGNLTIVNRDRKVQEGSRKRARNISPKRCGVLALKKNKKGRNKQAAFSCVCTTESVLRFIFLM